jgi:hypothetical protein
MKIYMFIPLLALLCGCMSLQEKNAALLIAAKAGDTPTVKKMLDSHANINTTDSSKETPLLAAIKNRHPETSALLASRGANLGAKDQYDDTPLNLAIKTRQRDTVDLLISKGANVNAKGALEDTPLHVSIYTGDPTMTSLLRSKGADETLLNRYGLNPEEMKAVPELEEKVVDAARLLSSSGEWTDSAKARPLYDGLKGQQDKYVVNALVLRVIRGDDLRSRVLLLAIKLGIPGSEEKLGALLMVYGYKQMAEDYLNSGSSLLHSSGADWANAHGYHIRTGSGSHRSGWGRF